MSKMRKLLNLEIRRGFAEMPFILVDIREDSREFGGVRGSTQQVRGLPCWTTPDEAREAAAELIGAADRVRMLREGKISDQ